VSDIIVRDSNGQMFAEGDSVLKTEFLRTA